ncbi:hypothetical protein [Streptomyces sp. Inha503]|uniref:hypothetical protein n=1 Tax=Streptomyces sp. Inha503 TaxID=3383314 RepID=UPI0039A08103
MDLERLCGLYGSLLKIQVSPQHHRLGFWVKSPLVHGGSGRLKREPGQELPDFVAQVVVHDQVVSGQTEVCGESVLGDWCRQEVVDGDRQGCHRLGHGAGDLAEGLVRFGSGLVEVDDVGPPPS